MDSANKIRFAAEKTLGKLARWLRILGFDTLYEPGLTAEKLICIGEGRILLTRTTRIQNMNVSQRLIFITKNNPFEQVRDVIKILDITPKDTRPFSRCIRCNTLVREVDKDSIRGMVADYTWETHDAFHMCALCRRIYWSGSHTRRTHDIIKKLFG